jgi:hypothetical protein
MSRHADHAAKIIAAVSVRRRVSGRRDSQDHHLAAGRDSRAGNGQDVPQRTDADRKPGTTTDHSGKPSRFPCPAPTLSLPIPRSVMIRARLGLARADQPVLGRSDVPYANGRRQLAEQGCGRRGMTRSCGCRSAGSCRGMRWNSRYAAGARDITVPGSGSSWPAPGRPVASPGPPPFAAARFTRRPAHSGTRGWPGSPRPGG